MPKTDFEVRFWQPSDHSHPYSAGLASTLPIGRPFQLTVTIALGKIHF
ncbi:hypothetical protein [Paenibacillus odorifer]|nr:hypothetical protein [Paenibacillus odorifer]